MACNEEEVFVDLAYASQRCNRRAADAAGCFRSSSTSN
jgi:hypothetical protein